MTIYIPGFINLNTLLKIYHLKLHVFMSFALIPKLRGVILFYNVNPLYYVLSSPNFRLSFMMIFTNNVILYKYNATHNFILFRQFSKPKSAPNSFILNKVCLCCKCQLRGHKCNLQRPTFMKQKCPFSVTAF